VCEWSREWLRLESGTRVANDALLRIIEFMANVV
jgi:hypothetical protein